MTLHNFATNPFFIVYVRNRSLTLRLLLFLLNPEARIFLQRVYDMYLVSLRSFVTWSFLNKLSISSPSTTTGVLEHSRSYR